MLKKAIFPLLLTLMLSFTPDIANADSFASAFPEGVTRIWPGPEYYANRFLDWRIHEGRLECLEGRSEKPMRTVHLLTHYLGNDNGDFTIIVRTGPIGQGKQREETWTGFLIGVGGDHVDFRTSALCHHWPGEDGGLIVAIDGTGKIVFRDNSQGPQGLKVSNKTKNAWPLLQSDSVFVSNDPLPEELLLHLHGESDNTGYALTLSVFDKTGDRLLRQSQLNDVPTQFLDGNIAIISHGSPSGDDKGYWFDDLSVSGTKIQEDQSRSFGPILSAQHTLSNNILKMTAQFPALGNDDTRIASLEVNRDGAWQEIATAPIEDHSFVAAFRIPDWPIDERIPYRVAYDLNLGGGKTQTAYYEGAVRKPPANRDDFIIAAFTGHHISAQGKGHWNQNHLWYPHNELVAAIKYHNPDFLFFSGDQIYEGGLAGIVREPAEDAIIDYQYHWVRWCWAFRELTRDLPTITLPDDHDVYHGNIWGAGGKKGEARDGITAQDSGGYTMDPLFVNTVHRTQVSNLPDPYDPAPILQNISVYHTSMEYAGLSFAILADRMWKSAPAIAVPEGGNINGWFEAPGFDPRTQSDVPGAVLLGDRQLRFLDEWTADWRAGAQMKFVLSQTIFANVATLPADAINDKVVPGMKQSTFQGEYMEGDKVVADADSNGWPRSGRDRAVRALRKGFAYHIAGDQHLGSMIQYGLDDYRDSSYAFCVPAIANTWPRRWFPPEPGLNRESDTPKYTGDHRDGFDNRITVHAVSNPGGSGAEPAALYDRAPGYGIVRVNKKTRTITSEAWPRWVDPSKPNAKPYPGWPVQCEQSDNYRGTDEKYLPEITVLGVEKPVYHVINETTGERLYTLRATSSTFRPKVFDNAVYTLKITDPDKSWIKVLTGLTPKENAQAISINLP